MLLQQGRVSKGVRPLAATSVETPGSGARGLTPSPQAGRGRTDGERMSAELSIERLRKVFPTGVAAVDDVSFRIERGEIVVLLGPSGCGKTTTLRCVAGLEHPTSGVIGIGGSVVSAPERGLLLPPRLRNIGMVFQSYAVWPH